VLIRADLKASTFDLSVNGITARGLPFGVEGVHRIQCLSLSPNTRNCVLYIDRVKVTVEP